ncbi:MAG: M48 family metalloprotease [Bacteroidetes bacterium]|nr:M48 family metalloprotease [Bacteroidota bacterium]
MNALIDFFGYELINALGWSIFHILWQGVILILFLGLLLRLLRNKSSNVRYNIAVIGLVAIVGLSAMNFVQNYNKSANSNIELPYYQDISKNVLFDFSDTENDFYSVSAYDDIKSIVLKVDKYFPFMVNLWILGVILFTLKFIFSFLYTIRLKNTKTRPVSIQWIKRFENLQDRLRIQKSIAYLESYIIKIPVVLGHLKPVVLVPAEMLTGMPGNQIEAIIAHELAHIRRNDYIINVLQTIVETIFFFHPAVWYISAQIRKERENCCDDLALTVCNESIVYAKALVSIQELTLNRHYSAVAFSGNKKHLLNRIKRMIMKPKEKSNITDKLIAAFIIFSSFIALSFSYAAEINSNLSDLGYKTEINSIPVLTDEDGELLTTNTVKSAQDVNTVLTESNDTVNIRYHHQDEFDIDDNTVIRTYTDEKGKKEKIRFTLVNGKATDLYVDGKKVPEKDYDKYQDRIDDTIEALKKAKADVRKAMKDIEDLDIEELRREMEEAMKNVNVDVAQIQEEIANSMAEMKEIDVQKMMEDIEKGLESLEDLNIDFDDHELNIRIEDMDIDINLDEIRAQMEKTREALHENIDMKAIEEELKRVQEEMSQLDQEKIRIQMHKSIEDFEQFDKQQTLKEMEETLEELEQLELEEK